MRQTVRSSTGRPLKPGNIIRVVAIPPEVHRQSPRDTRRLFRAMVGRRFKVRGVVLQPLVLLELDVSIVGVPLLGSTAHHIWIEPEYVA
jgi:hypothetical protein